MFARIASPAALSQSSSRAREMVSALAALMLGLLVVGMVGFSHLDILHNAAHDTRHSNAFPCH